MANGLPLEILKIFTYLDEAARQSKHLFAELKTKYSTPNAASTYEYDVFVSYSRDDATVANSIAELLAQHGRRLFIDVQSIEKGAAWPQRIFVWIRQRGENGRRLLTVLRQIEGMSGRIQRRVLSAHQEPEVIFPIYWK